MIARRDNDDNSSRADRQRRWPRADRLRRDRILYLASCRCLLSRACTLRLGLLTTDLLRARRVPRPRDTCQRFRLPQPLFGSPRRDPGRRCAVSTFRLIASVLSDVARGWLSDQGNG